MKLVRLPDPLSVAELKRKGTKPLAIGATFVGALCFISYFAQLVNWFFSLAVPLYFFSISFRFIATVLVSIWAYFNRDEIVEFVTEKLTELAENRQFFTQLEEKEGLAKLRLLSERQKTRKELRLARQEAENAL